MELTLIGVAAGALVSWAITHIYHQKATKELNAGDLNNTIGTMLETLNRLSHELENHVEERETAAGVKETIRATTALIRTFKHETGQFIAALDWLSKMLQDTIDRGDLSAAKRHVRSMRQELRSLSQGMDSVDYESIVATLRRSADDATNPQHIETGDGR